MILTVLRMILMKRIVSMDKVRGTLPSILGNMARASSDSLAMFSSEKSNICHNRSILVKFVRP